MKIKALFPKWQAVSTNPGIDWDREIAIDDDATFYTLLIAVIEDQSSSLRDRPREFEPISKAIMQDLLVLQESPPEGCKLINLQFLQFEVALTPLRTALNTGDFGLVHDWIIDSCADDFTPAIARDFHSNRMWAFMESDISWITNNRSITVIDWSFAFYYYSRVRAALHDLAVIIFPVVLQALDEAPLLDEQAIECRCMIANWLIVYNHPAAGKFIEILQIIFNAPGINLASQIRIATLFVGVDGRFTNRPAKEWASWALQHGERELGSHEPFQLLWAQVDTIEDWNRLRKAIFAAAAHYSSSLQRLGSPTAIVQAIDERSSLLVPAVFRLVQFGRGADLLTMLRAWYGLQQNDSVLVHGVLFVLPGYEGGFAYLSDNERFRPATNERQFTELVAVTNEALGLTITVRGERSEPAVPKRAAEPSYALGTRFVETLANNYSFDALRPEMLEGRQAIISLPGYPHPIQALMAAVPGSRVLPISSSLQQPAADLQIRRALLWAAGNDLYSNFEIDAVQAILSRAGMVCDRRNGPGCRPQDFMTVYADPAYDLVWVAGHGEIDRWRDGSARLIAGGACLIGIDELIANTPRTAGRRLLILNICDGGVSAVNGSIHRLGLAPMLANSRQATISHLWPVRPPVAAAFGALMADALARRHNHFEAFADTLVRLHASSHDVVNAVRQVIPQQELVRRLENANLEMDNIFNWGSAAFFQ